MCFVPFERPELIQIRERAEHFGNGKHVTPTWKRAYQSLADAADHLDAMWARCSGVMPNVPDQPAATDGRSTQ